MQVKIKKVHPDAIIPKYQTPGAAGFDFHLVEDATLEPGEIALLPSGLVIQTPPGHVLLIFVRSSGPKKMGIRKANSVAVIDSDYAGPDDEVKLLLQNIRNEVIHLKKGDRVAQGLIMPVVQAEFEEVDEVNAPSRGGHGSTGI